MRTVSFQGTALSQSQRRSLEQQQAVARSFVNPILQRQIAEAERRLDDYQRETWYFDYEIKGTPCIAEFMGFTR